MKMQKLFLAVMLGIGSIPMVHAMQDGGCDTVLPKKTFDKRLDAAVCNAARNGNCKKLRHLLENNADLNARENGKLYSYTVLMLASSEGHVDAVKMLLSYAARVFDESSYIAFLTAREGFNENALIIASNSGHVDVVSVLLSNAAKILDKSSYTAFVDAHSLVGWTALIVASLCGHGEVVNLLLANAAQMFDRSSYTAFINAQNVCKSTALMCSSSEGHNDIVQALLKAGADANLKCIGGKTALDLAIENRHKEVIQTLCDGRKILSFFE